MAGEGVEVDPARWMGNGSFKDLFFILDESLN